MYSNGSNPNYSSPGQQPNTSLFSQSRGIINGPGNYGSKPLQENPRANQDDYGYPNPNNHLNTYQEHQPGTGTLESSARNGFIKKVYTLLSIQLLLTVAVCFWAMNSQFFKKAFVNLPAIITLSVLMIALSCVIGCCTQFMRKYGLPIFIIFTIVMSLFVGIACAGTKPHIVLAAAGLTTLIVVALTAFACLTDTDLTGFGPYLMVFSIVLFFFGIVAIFWHNPIVHLIYACLAALLFSVYLIFDTQLVLGKFQNAYSLDDSYVAAIQLYIDIIQIFLQLLQILSIFDN